ncbi:MAG: hypothetical protein JWQ04_3443, partial [Pedosphaera sp.]|nr:hypothetical protein [Pedosphaera sp.]
LGARQGWEQQAGEDGNDRDDNQQFDQRERRSDGARCCQAGSR